MKLMKSLLNLCLGLAAAMLIAGCVSAGRDFDTSKVSQIKKGETTEADLTGWFGKPTNRSVTSEGRTILNWAHYKSHLSPTGNVQSKTLTVMLGSDGKVANFTSSGGGL